MPSHTSPEEVALFEKGSQPFKAKARIMLLLGEQLIRDEVSAVFELIKNSYDADAGEVQVILENVSERASGKITVVDRGNGMSKDTILKSWLELGTLSKSEGGTRVSPGGRSYLGEKGLGRLAVHKLGWKTHLTSREKPKKDKKSLSETDLDVDWREFEKNQDQYLEKVNVQWSEHPPKAFPGETGYPHGTRIEVTDLHESWTPRMMERLGLAVDAMMSPFAGLKGFVVDFSIKDTKVPTIPKGNIQSVISTATYQFDASVDAKGKIVGSYEFNRPDVPHMARRKETVEYATLRPRDFPVDPVTKEQRKPCCGPFRFRLYAWDLSRRDKEAIFGATKTYEDVIKPNAGVRVFRDGFRVLPYGNSDDDWLGLDARRVSGTFETKISRNQILCMIEVTAKANPGLRDKSDREGLIDNQAFKDFRALVLAAIDEFEIQRARDRKILKKILGRTRNDKVARIERMLSQVEEILDSAKKGGRSDATFEEVARLVSNVRSEVTEVVQETEEPLLVAASMGLAYMIPVHETLRDLQRIRRILKGLTRELKDGKVKSQLEQAERYAYRADELISGTGRLFRRGHYEDINLADVSRQAFELMKDRFEDESVRFEVYPRNETVHGSAKFLLVVLLNLLDNSSHWLSTITGAKEVKIIVDRLKNGFPVVLVTDNGPGLQGELEDLAEAFVSRKEGGMGLGLYIADQIALAHHGRLRSFSPGEVHGLLSGASVGIVFPKKAGEDVQD